MQSDTLLFYRSMEQKIRTIIFGGSFDPIHVGHTALAAEALRQNLADEVWFMVSPLNPHKQGQQLTPEEQRLAMVQLAIEDEPRFKASDFEFTLPRPSYTLHTLQALEAAYPEREFLLLIGADNWEKFDRWYRGDLILECYPIIVYPRGNELQPLLPQGVKWLASELYDISSTQIRELVASGADIQGSVSQKVSEYINKNRLYK